MMVKEIALIAVFIAWYLNSLISDWNDNCMWYNWIYALFKPAVMPTIVCGIIYILFF